MKVSYNWLKEYINFKTGPKELADKLTMAGIEVKGIEGKAGDSIYEIEVTSNRPDWLSIYGIAREIQAITGAKLKPIKSGLSKTQKPSASLITIEDKKGCSRYVGRLIEGAQVGISPKWLIERIESAGIRQVNNVVDITNFCLMESGQPLHAFDYDKLEGGKIIVRKAGKGEEIVTIDGIKRKLDENILVIADAKKPVAIAGIMGGKDTEVTFSTKRVLLESAYFDPATIRKASKSLALSTDSSYRFERSVDLEGTLSASNRATALICDLAKSSGLSKASDVGIKSRRQANIKLSVSKTNKILGLDIPGAKCASILKNLCLKVKQKGKDALEVIVPSFRGDIKQEIDLVEEIARIYGYDKVPETLTGIPLWGRGKQKSDDRIVEEIARESLVGMGLNEVITYSLTSKTTCVNRVMNLDDKKLAKVRNPLSSESEALRAVALGGLLDVIAYNINRKISDIRIFEMGKSYFCGDDGIPSERQVLTIALCGMKVKDWHRKEAVDVFDLKGIIEALLERLGIAEIGLAAKGSPLFSLSVSSGITLQGKEAGMFGKISREIMDSYDIKGSIFACELDLRSLCDNAKLEHKIQELPKYPSTMRDISLIVDDKVPNSDIMDLIKETCGRFAVCIKPFDLYRGEQVPKGCKSILYSVEYRVSDRTLTDEEVNSLDKKVREVLAQRFNANIR